MLNNEYIPTLFFFNPNIYPVEEYLKRKKECIAYSQFHNIDFIDGDYDHERWLQQIVGLEEEPERGARCLQCFRVRLYATALIASELQFKQFTTTLTGSRWKSLVQITEAGKWAAAQCTNLDFWDKDWKKGGLTERRKILLQKNNFYNQQYCGCEFSIRK
jgi:predicted adenine nucleotide alpha hydrolase (AANH) superfamily ATPase